MLEYLQQFERDGVEVLPRSKGDLAYVRMNFDTQDTAMDFQRARMEAFRAHGLMGFEVLVDEAVDPDERAAYAQAHGGSPGAPSKGGFVVVSLENCDVPGLPAKLFDDCWPALVPALREIWALCAYSYRLLGECLACCTVSRDLEEAQLAAVADQIFESQKRHFGRSGARAEIKASLREGTFYVGPR